MLGSRFTRRTFAKLLGGALASRAVLALRSARPNETRFACIATRGTADAGLHLFSIDVDQWLQVDFIPAAEPSALAVLPGGRGLVVANAVSEFQNRPTGYVESYSLNREPGRLSLISRRSLSLAATAPHRVAISNCGSHVAVLAAGGSILNILPLSDSGIIGSPSLVRKRIASVAPHCRLPSFNRAAFGCDDQLLWLEDCENFGHPLLHNAMNMPHATALVLL